MSLSFTATANHKYAIELIGNHVSIYRYVQGKHRHLYLGDCWIDVRAAVPRWFIQQHGLTATSTNANSGEDAALMLISQIEKFEVTHKQGNPSFANAKRLLADIRQPQRQLVAGRSASRRINGISID